MTTERTIRDLMSKNVVTVPDDLPVAELTRRLTDAHVSGAPVLNRHRKLCGVVSASDIVSNALKVGRRPRTELSEADYYGRPDLGTHADIARLGMHVEDIGDQLVSDIMTPIVISTTADASVAEVAALMRLNRIHRVLIVEDDELLGVVSALDLVGMIPTAYMAKPRVNTEIMLATDLGPSSMDIAREASRLAIERGAKLVAVHVTPNLETLLEAYGERVDLIDLQKQFEETSLGLLEKLRKELGNINQEVELIGRAGNPSAVIAEIAAARRPELVVIGAKRSAEARLPGIGSVAEKILASSPVPVLMIPHQRA